MRSGKMRGISAQQIHQGSRKSHSMQGQEPAYSMKTAERVIFGVSNHV